MDVADRGGIVPPTYKPYRYVRFLTHAALVLGGIGAGLLIAEVGLRGYYFWRTELELSRMSEAGGTETLDTPQGALAPGVRLSAHPNVVYELRPSLRGTYDGRRHATNRFGFRQDQDFTIGKPSGVRRIVGIGDSWMWGSGVDNGQTYLDRLAERFAREGRSVEVINTGVWGYNAVQQVATLRQKARFFSPDVVVIGLCGNDREYPAFVDQRPFVALTDSFVWNEIAGRLGWARRPGFRVGELMPFTELESAYAELASLAEGDGFRVVVFSDCFAAERGRASRHCALGTEAEWARFERHLDDWGFRRCRWDIDALPQNDVPYGHATEEGNRQLASVLADCVRGVL